MSSTTTLKQIIFRIATKKDNNLMKLRNQEGISPKLDRLRIQGWRQFDNIDIELHDSLTIVTGANGAGKSTLLKIMANELGYNNTFLATAKIQDRRLKFSSSIFQNVWSKFSTVKTDKNQIGFIDYTDSIRSFLKAPEPNSAEYKITYENENTIFGLFYSSHRIEPRYNKLRQSFWESFLPKKAYKSFDDALRDMSKGNNSNVTPLYRMKEALISLYQDIGKRNNIYQSETNKDENSLSEQRNKFEEVMRIILPDELGYKHLEIRENELIVISQTGEFLLEAASGGILNLIEIAWRIFIYSQLHTDFIVFIDEPENHLHPSMQKRLLGDLVKAFPNVQFIIATHSPLMVSSVKKSNIYALRYKTHTNNPNSAADDYDNEISTPFKRIVSEKLDITNISGTASEILREVLGVPSTIPDWVVSKLDIVIEKYKSQKITGKSLASLRSELDQLGFGNEYADTLHKIALHQNDLT